MKWRAPDVEEKTFLPIYRNQRTASERMADASWRMDVQQTQTYGMIGDSARMHSLYETIHATIDSDASVLIEGESGTGKELIAAAFHVHGKRSEKPFVKIHCAAIPSELMESELFGYKRGAFSGARKDKRGLVQIASGGTLLLDEITELPLHLQAKLLRVLQERKVRRLGDDREVDADFRLITETNRDSRQAIKSGLLREDLYFRLGTVRIKVPPLRDRVDDVMLLA
ncbi:MAG: sigma 54-interacting transcriptional regulator, partial [Blastocatellia bacterium]